MRTLLDAYKARQRLRLTDAESERLEHLSRRDRTWAEEIEWRTLSWLPDFVGQDARDRAAADARTPLALNMECNRAFSREAAAWSEDDERRRWSDVTCPVWIIHGRRIPDLPTVRSCSPRSCRTEGSTRCPARAISRGTSART
ncbi:hypothetical protein [Pseudonocardia phyllosphaerae]|uniref:hypothetical protein n=1 Tax=Pseudonocardia phyllosphaerae TaxID=3390502 RepID=UPI00397B83BC